MAAPGRVLWMFRSTGSYEPDPLPCAKAPYPGRFRSTGSYEPDHHRTILLRSPGSFDPQALTSLTGHASGAEVHLEGFDPQALTSLTIMRHLGDLLLEVFRSTGSYEPDPQPFSRHGEYHPGFDPQALTSLTNYDIKDWIAFCVSIHRLLQA